MGSEAVWIGSEIFKTHFWVFLILNYFKIFEKSVKGEEKDVCFWIINIVVPIVFAIACIFAVTKTMMDKRKAERYRADSQVHPEMENDRVEEATKTDRPRSGFFRVFRYQNTPFLIMKSSYIFTLFFSIFKL